MTVIELDGYWEIAGAECTITIEKRPRYCDRGNFIAKLHPTPGSALALEIDEQDCWPRYYFDFDRAVAEIDAWLEKRGQKVAPAPLRRARVVNARTVAEVERYLPDNYAVERSHFETGGRFVVEISGRDVHGWTLDQYVIPRLASGLIYATEIPEGATP